MIPPNAPIARGFLGLSRTGASPNMGQLTHMDLRGGEFFWGGRRPSHMPRRGTRGFVSLLAAHVLQQRLPLPADGGGGRRRLRRLGAGDQG